MPRLVDQTIWRISFQRCLMFGCACFSGSRMESVVLSWSILENTTSGLISLCLQIKKAKLLHILIESDILQRNFSNVSVFYSDLHITFSILTILPCLFLFECVWFNSNNYNNNHIHIRKASLVVWCTLFLYKILIVAFQYILESNQIKLNQPEVQLIKFKMVDALAGPLLPQH